MIPYTYVVIRYIPDVGAGEMLNVGVVLHSTVDGTLLWRMEEHYERLSNAFADFNGKHYRRALTRIQRALQEVAEQSDSRLRLSSASQSLRTALSDVSLSFQVSEDLGGVSDDLRREVAILFDRMVASRIGKQSERTRRSNDEVWESVFEPMLPPDVRQQLKPRTFQTADVDVHVSHAFKNGAWHIVQPVSLDYRSPQTIHKHASQWVGTALGLQSSPDLARIYFLLGAPEDESLRTAYEKARRLLGKAPVEHRIIEEHQAEEFAGELTDLVRSHQP